MSFWQWLEKRLVTADDPLPRGSAVIIGVGIDVSAVGNSASPYSKAVANKCGELFRAGYGHRIIFTGGYFKPHVTGVTEARGMERHLTADIPRTSWLSNFEPNVPVWCLAPTSMPTMSCPC